MFEIKGESYKFAHAIAKASLAQLARATDL